MNYLRMIPAYRKLEDEVKSLRSANRKAVKEIEALEDALDLEETRVKVVTHAAMIKEATVTSIGQAVVFLTESFSYPVNIANISTNNLNGLALRAYVDGNRYVLEFLALGDVLIHDDKGTIRISSNVFSEFAKIAGLDYDLF